MFGSVTYNTVALPQCFSDVLNRKDVSGNCGQDVECHINTYVVRLIAALPGIFL
jgi:hypothetical protein